MSSGGNKSVNGAKDSIMALVVPHSIKRVNNASDDADVVDRTCNRVTLGRVQCIVINIVFANAGANVDADEGTVVPLSIRRAINAVVDRIGTIDDDASSFTTPIEGSYPI
jgi:phage tail protein X